MLNINGSSRACAGLSEAILTLSCARYATPPGGQEGSHCVDCIGFGRAFVWPIRFHTCESQRHSAGIVRAALDIVERNFHYELWSNVNDMTVTANLPGQ